MRKCKLTVNRGSKALEMKMRDVLDGLEEIANFAQYHNVTEPIEILSIEQPETAPHAPAAQITNIQAVNDKNSLHRSKDVVSFLLEREERLNSLSA